MKRKEQKSSFGMQARPRRGGRHRARWSRICRGCFWPRRTQTPPPPHTHPTLVHSGVEWPRLHMATLATCSSSLAIRRSWRMTRSLSDLNSRSTSSSLSSIFWTKSRMKVSSTKFTYLSYIICNNIQKEKKRIKVPYCAKSL